MSSHPLPAACPRPPDPSALRSRINAFPSWPVSHRLLTELLDEWAGEAGALGLLVEAAASRADTLYSRRRCAGRGTLHEGRSTACLYLLFSVGQQVPARPRARQGPCGVSPRPPRLVAFRLGRPAAACRRLRGEGRPASEWAAGGQRARRRAGAGDSQRPRTMAALRVPHRVGCSSAARRLLALGQLRRAARRRHTKRAGRCGRRRSPGRGEVAHTEESETSQSLTCIRRHVTAICFSLLKLLFSAARAVHCTAAFALRCAASAASRRRQLEAAASPWPSILCGFRASLPLPGNFFPARQGAGTPLLCIPARLCPVRWAPRRM